MPSAQDNGDPILPIWCRTRQQGGNTIGVMIPTWKVRVGAIALFVTFLFVVQRQQYNALREELRVAIETSKQAENAAKTAALSASRSEQSVAALRDAATTAATLSSNNSTENDETTTTTTTTTDSTNTTADSPDFECTVPLSKRLGSSCWLKAARGTMPRTSDGRLPGGRSQGREDLFLSENYFFKKTGGTFLELGALDGLMYSNSYYFEQSLGWRGVLIEGSPVLYQKLRANRPEAITVNAMICAEPRQLHWIETSNAIGGAWELMQDGFKKVKHPTMTDEKVAELPTVPCVRLDSVMARFGVTHVDLFSLDVEGAELSVLQAIDFNRFSASVIVSEYRPGQRGVDDILKRAGYLKHNQIGSNHVFLHPKFAETLPR